MDLDEFVADEDNRYHTVNLTRTQEDVELVEVRMHGGTYQFRKIALWIALWMQILNPSSFDQEGRGTGRQVFLLKGEPRTPRMVGREDIIVLLAAEGIALTPEFAQLLRQRRRELRELWRK